MIETTSNQIEEIRAKIKSGKIHSDEKVWTFLAAHLIDKAETKNGLLQRFTKEDVAPGNDLDLWFEPEPMPPRQGISGNTEGNTKLDLAFGDIRKRGDTKAGIEFGKKNNWVCFVEAKLYSDCSTSVSYDPFRNQITRVIENLITFQSGHEFPDRTFFCLLTPRIFKQRPFSKLYGYKYFEYQDRENIRKDMDACAIPMRNTQTWSCPKETLRNRLDSLTMNWTTYEEIIEAALGIQHLDVSVSDSDEYRQIMGVMREIAESY